MSKKYNYIYWRPDLNQNEKGEIFAHVHILIKHEEATISDLQKMADEIQEIFPQATHDKICASKVICSAEFRGSTIVVWDGHIPQGDYPGWKQIEGGKTGYGW